MKNLQAALEAATSKAEVRSEDGYIYVRNMRDLAGERLAALAPVMAAELVQAEAALQRIADHRKHSSDDMLCLKAAIEEAELALARLAAVDRQASDEMRCDRCGVRHGIVWFAPSDVWNKTMRSGDRGNPDVYGFCCPHCFMQMTDAFTREGRSWLVMPFDDGPVDRADQIVLAGKDSNA